MKVKLKKLDYFLYFKRTHPIASVILVVLSNLFSGKMSKIYHGISDQFSSKMMKTDVFKSYEQSFKFVLPRKKEFYGSESFIINLLIE